MSNLKVLGLALFSAVIFAGCNTATNVAEPSSDDAMMEEDSTLIESQDAMMEGDSMEKDGDAMMEKTDGQTSMTIDMFAFGYSQEEIMVEPGETLVIKLTNSGGMHDFDIDELNIDSEVIQEGEEATVTVQIPADATSGTTYAYYCSVANHRAQGMEGMIVVK